MAQRRAPDISAQATPDGRQAGDEQLRAMLESHPSWVCGVDEAMRYVYVNASFCRLLERPAEEIIGRTADEVLGMRQSASRWDMLRRSLAGEPDLWAERVGVDGEGRDRVSWVRYHCVEYGTPPRKYAYSFGFDITELRQAQQRVSAVTQGVGVGLWEYSLASGAFECNEVLLALLGHAGSDLPEGRRRGLGARLDARDQERYRQRLAHLHEGTVSDEVGTFRAIHKDGHTVWFEERLRVLARDAQGRPLRVAGVVQDISRLKAREHELETLNRELESRIAQRTQALALAKQEAERANAAKSEFLSTMSHELRTPLNAILGFGQLLALSALPAQAAGQVQQMMRAGQQLLTLIDEILDLAAVESGRIALRFEAVALAALVEECCGMLRPAAQAAGVVLEAQDIPADAVVRADYARLRQALLNLVANAIKYNAARPGRVRIRVEHSGPQAAGEAWRLQVSDTGRGMDAQQLARLFEPFDRLGAERSGIPGSGIGLTITKRLVEMMDGSIEVSSTPGVGSVFDLCLPAAINPGPDAPVRAA
ncbi:MAG: hypothetical protein ABS84_04140 [Rubrivivax sp. SCN 71-131]|jgi:PAS domain S-box-containing protein|nr:MAG: hypothetical protein ABS84_04140 [Rubrivivax sp. SCN 71-131]